jgi:hypothetical protein
MAFRTSQMRRQVAALGGMIVLLAATAPIAMAADVTPPTGTLTIGTGSGYASSLTLTLHVPATDDVGVTTLMIFLNGELVSTRPYAPTVTLAVPQPSEWHVGVHWRDAAGNGFSADAYVQVDPTPPNVGELYFFEDPDPTDLLIPASIQNTREDGSPISAVRFRTGAGAWGAAYPAPAGNPMVIDWAAFDPAFGGSPLIGSRTVSAQVQNAAGLWSASTSRTMDASPGALTIAVSGDVRTGHPITLTPTVPAGLVYPAGTVCWWELYWGDDASLYYGNRNETFGGITISGPVSGGYCNPWTVTIPWVPQRQFLVSFRADTGAQAGLGAMIGGFPGDPTTLRPGVDSTSRSITYSSLPMVYVLPDVYQLVVGVPATYRAFALAGAKILSTDQWSVEYIDHPEFKLGGSVFTFTPKIPGHITVCWNGRPPRLHTIAACYDPPARYPDTTKPVTTAPVQQLGTTSVTSTGVRLALNWSGSDRGWGIKSYVLQRSTNGGAWTSVSLASATATSVGYTATPGSTLRFRVRAADKAGNVGAWAYGPTFRVVLGSDSNAAVRYSGAWNIVAGAASLSGASHRTSVRGASASYTFSGRDFSWISAKGPTFGKAAIYVNGLLKATVDLYSATAAPRRITYRIHWSTVGTRTIKIVNLATSGRPIIDLDGLTLLR